MINPNGVAAYHDDDDHRPHSSCEWNDLSSDHLFHEYNAHLDLSTTNEYPSSAVAGSIISDVTDQSSTSILGSSSSSSSGEDDDDDVMEDKELGEFLMDAFDDFEPRFLADIANVCV